MSPDFAWMRLLAPEGIVVAGALAALAAHLGQSGKTSRLGAWLAGLGCVGAMVALPFTPISPLLALVKFILLALTLFTIVISAQTKFTRHVGEYFALLLLAAVGLMLLAGADNLLMIFVALELLSICVYVLTAFNKASLASAEAGLKYFLFGGMAAAFTLFGLSLIYGVTGEIQLAAIAGKLKAPQEPIFYVGLVMTLAGFAFKLAAAPFHFWAPDVYQGAPTPVASYIASASKVGSFFVLARILLVGALPNWTPVIVVLAVLSMVIGNVAALVQSNVKRLLAYSAIAHAGYALLSFLATPATAVPAMVFYVSTYAIAVLGAFAVLHALEDSGVGDTLTDLAGLARRSPGLSFCMLVFVLSLAGIPPLSGFFGKFYVFTVAAAGAPKLGSLWLVIIAVATSAVSLYYYLQILKQIYAGEPAAGSRPLGTPFSTRLAIVLLAVLVVTLGCAPDLLLHRITLALQLAPF